MIIRSPRPTTAYTVIENRVIRDHRLSWRARGLLVYLLSMPDNWRTNSVHLTKLGREGRDAVRAALAELEAAGYLSRERHQNARGHWVSRTVVFDTPRDIHNHGHNHVDNSVTEA